MQKEKTFASANKTRTGIETTTTGTTPDANHGGAADGAGKTEAAGRRRQMRRATFRKSLATTATAKKSRKGSRSTREKSKASCRSLRQ